MRQFTENMWSETSTVFNLKKQMQVVEVIETEKLVKIWGKKSPHCEVARNCTENLLQ